MNNTYSNELYHHGILGQKWGKRRWQNEDGTLTPEGRIHYLKKDAKWAKKNYKKIYNHVYSKSKREVNDYVENDLNNRMSLRNESGSLSLAYVNEFNRKLAEVMTKNASDISAPSGHAIKFIAKRGGVGAQMVVSDTDFNTQIFKNGVYDTGRVAYKKTQVNME